MPEEKEYFLVDKEELGKDHAERAKNLKELIEKGAEDFTPDELEILKFTHKNLEALAAQDARADKKEIKGTQDPLTDRDIEKLLVKLGYDRISHNYIHTLIDRALNKLKYEFTKLGISYDDFQKSKHKPLM